MRTISYVTEFYQRIGSCVVVVVLRAVDTRRRLHPYNDHTLGRLGARGTRSVYLETAVLRHDLVYGADAVDAAPSTSNKNCIPLQNHKTRFGT